MKQHITLAQLAELPNEQKEKLVELVYGYPYKLDTISDLNKPLFLTKLARDCTIGQMIKILEHLTIYPIPPGLMSPAPSMKWMVEYTPNRAKVSQYHEKEELADALWKATKAKLREIVKGGGA